MWEKIYKNRQIRNKNCLWWPCLLTDRDEISNHYTGPSIDASYQVSVNLAKRFVSDWFITLKKSLSIVVTVKRDITLAFKLLKER
jgi:hypothetical protein